MLEDGHPHWVRTALPAAGGVGDQDALLLNTLDHLRGVYDELTRDAVARRQNDRALATWREQRSQTKRTA